MIASEESAPIVDMSILQGLRAYARSAAFLPQLIDIFEEHGRNSLNELRSALSGQDLDAVRRVAHRFKGSCLNMGAQALATELRRYELGQFENMSDSQMKWPEKDVEVACENLSHLFEATCKCLKSVH